MNDVKGCDWGRWGFGPYCTKKASVIKINPVSGPVPLCADHAAKWASFPTQP